jgi:TFIIF-interacting CTD phosphatase-like protein
MSGKKNILLDLDQTLISAEPTEEVDFKKDKDKMKKFKFHNMDGYYIVFERPGLQEFLTYLFANFNVSIWTAASKDYALFVIDKAILAGKANRKIDYVFFSYHCDISQALSLKKGTKDLNMLWDYFCMVGYSRDNTMILDDYDDVYNTQKNNCIIAEPFEFSKSDSFQDKFLSRLVTELRDSKDKKVQDLVDRINQNMKRS